MEGNFLNKIKVVCRRPDSNRHGSPHHPLKMACLPSSTTSAVKAIIEKEHRFGNLLVGSAHFLPERAAYEPARYASPAPVFIRLKGIRPICGHVMFSCYSMILDLYFIWNILLYNK